eukprot:TRINITY_DN8990_c0_g1_i1.p1 TRINITY_DN8990_c0_g1~~TRINITY_DN8990_c0_g1_i1.p1  ORF type:complete len:257 (-),score=32.20 TRINITY_DN8990_c0_g1_i1:120-890(-)
MEYFPNVQVDTYSELETFEQSGAVHVARIEISAPDSHGVLNVGTYYVKFENYEESGFYEDFINTRLRGPGSCPQVITAVKSGICMLSDKKNKLLDDLYTFMVIPSAGVPIYELQAPTVDLALIMSSLESLMRWYAKADSSVRSSTLGYTFHNYDLTPRNIAWHDTLGFCSFDFGHSFMQVIENESIVTVMPNKCQRLSKRPYPDGQTAVREFAKTIADALGRLTYEGNTDALKRKLANLRDGGYRWTEAVEFVFPK